MVAVVYGWFSQEVVCATGWLCLYILLGTVAYWWLPPYIPLLAVAYCWFSKDILCVEGWLSPVFLVAAKYCGFSQDTLLAGFANFCLSAEELIAAATELLFFSKIFRSCNLKKGEKNAVFF